MRVHQEFTSQPPNSEKQNDILTYEWSKGYISTFHPKNGDSEGASEDKNTHH